MIRQAEISDSSALAQIYNHYVRGSNATFQIEELTLDQIASQIEASHDDGFPFWVYEVRGSVVGYCSLSRWNIKQAYDPTAEISIYIDPSYAGRGFGSELIKHLLLTIDRERFHSLMACITIPNTPSVTLHQKFGFVRVSLLREVGRKFDQWHDVTHWQLILTPVSNHLNGKTTVLANEQSCPCGAHYHCRCQ